MRYTCPEYDADNDHSCLFAMEGDTYTRHLVFSRRIEDHEWSQFSSRVDEVAWDKHRWDWDVAKMADLMREITGDQDIVKSGES